MQSKHSKIDKRILKSLKKKEKDVSHGNSNGLTQMMGQKFLNFLINKYSEKLSSENPLEANRVVPLKEKEDDLEKMLNNMGSL